jgi:hypothetical protein
MARPLKFSSVDELQEAIDLYFFECDPHIADVTVFEYPKKKVKRGARDWDEDDLDAEPQESIKRRVTEQIPYGVAGLAYSLGTTRDTLIDYESGKYDKKPEDADYDPSEPSFSDTIKNAKARILGQKEFRLATGKVNPIAGIFDLKVNHGYMEARAPLDPEDDKPHEFKLTIDYADNKSLPLAKQSLPSHANAIDAELIDDDEIYDDDEPVLVTQAPTVRIITENI